MTKGTSVEKLVKSKTAFAGDKVNAPFLDEKATTTTLSGKEEREILNDAVRPLSETSYFSGPATTKAG
jgi:hypothetical protein